MTLKKIDISTITKAVKNCTTPTQKTIIEKIDISSKWETQLPLYLDLYSKLSVEGKKEMQRQVKVIGALVDRMQTIRKEKQNENTN